MITNNVITFKEHLYKMSEILNGNGANTGDKTYQGAYDH